AGRSLRQIGGRSSPTSKSSSASTRRAPRQRQPRRRRRQTGTNEDGHVSNGVMNGAMNRKVLILLGPVAGIVMFIAVVWMATVFVGRSEYRDPSRAPAAPADPTPRTAPAAGGAAGRPAARRRRGRRNGGGGHQGQGDALRRGRV